MSDLAIMLPVNLNELIGYLNKADTKTYLLSGGTDLIIKLKKNKVYTGTLIDLSGIKELKFIKRQDDSIRIGAGTTFREISDSYLIKDNCRCLVEAASQVGSLQIRNSATIGGNIANASPGADSIPALLALGASVKIMKGNGVVYEKTIDEVILGPGINSLKADEVIIEIAIPILDKGYKSSFGKIGLRTTVTIARLNVAAVIKYDTTRNIIEAVRVTLGAIAPKAFSSVIVESALIGKCPSENLLEEFQKALVKQVDDSIHGRSSHAYKREAIRGLAQDVYYQLFEA